MERRPTAGEEDARAVGKTLGLRPVPAPGAATRAGERWPFGSAVRARMPVYTIARSGDLREDDARKRHSRRDRTVPAGWIGLVLRDARGRLAVRDARVEGHRALRRAHVLQGHRAPAGRPHDLHRDRRDRRRVQRLHGQGAHGLLRPLRVGDARHRARRPRRHAPPLEVRRGRDHEGEGRDPRGDERLPRHAAALRRKRLRPAPVRGSAPRLGHPRHTGDDRGHDARDLHVVPRHVVPAGTDGRRARRSDRGRAGRTARGALRRHRAATDRRADGTRSFRRTRRRSCCTRRTRSRRT